MDNLELWIKEGDKVDIFALNCILEDAILQY